MEKLKLHKLFTNYITFFLSKFKFVFTYLSRFVRILFRKEREIQKLYLDYSDDFLFENSYIILNYRFRNAIYYRFADQISFDKKLKIFDLNNFEREFELIVYGFFQQKTYLLKFEPNLILKSTDFKIEFQNLNNIFDFKSIPNLKAAIFEPNLDDIVIKKSKIAITKIEIILKHKQFKQNEFI